MSRDQLTIIWPRQPLQGTHSEGLSKSIPLTYNGMGCMGLGVSVHDEVLMTTEEARRLSESQLRGLSFTTICVDDPLAPDCDYGSNWGTDD